MVIVSLGGLTWSVRYGSFQFQYISSLENFFYREKTGPVHPGLNQAKDKLSCHIAFTILGMLGPTILVPVGIERRKRSVGLPQSSPTERRLPGPISDWRISGPKKIW